MSKNDCSNKIEINIITRTKLKVDPVTKMWYVKSTVTEYEHKDDSF